MTLSESISREFWIDLFSIFTVFFKSKTVSPVIESVHPFYEIKQNANRITCSECFGRTKINSIKCLNCDGFGHVAVSK